MPVCIDRRLFLSITPVPANDSVYDNLMEMRQKLGWVTEIPRHGPDCKKDMEKLRDKPVSEKVRCDAVFQHLHDGTEKMMLIFRNQECFVVSEESNCT